MNRDLAEFAPGTVLDPAKAPRWRNHYITRRGTIRATYTHPSEAVARGYADDFFTEWRDYVAKGGLADVDLPGGGRMPFQEFVCAVQIPDKG